MNLPQLPADKANHLGYGAAIGAAAACVAVMLGYSAWAGIVAAGAATACGVLKEARDAWVNVRASGHAHSGPHGLEFWDFACTVVGGVLVALPLLMRYES